MSPHLWKRFAAFLIDIAFILLLLSSAFLLLDEKRELQISLLPGFVIYKTLSEVIFKTTLGKFLFGFRIRDKYGYTVGGTRCIMRNIHLITIGFSYILDELLQADNSVHFNWWNIGLQLGFILVFIDGFVLVVSKKQQALHDIPAGTYLTL